MEVCMARSIYTGGRKYIFMSFILIFSCLLITAFIYIGSSKLINKFVPSFNLDELTEIAIPGSGDVTFTRKGAYAVYYEYRGVIQGVHYTYSSTPPDLTCNLRSKTTLQELAIVDDYVKTNTYSSEDGNRTGVLIRSITVDEPGIYTLSCQYTNGNSGPAINLAVGPNFIWEYIRNITHVSTASKSADIPPRGCTIFTASLGDQVFFGGNGDWINFDSNYYWVNPGSNTRYGAIYFGKPDNVQQGFNEKGLAYDSNGLPSAPVSSHSGRIPVYGDHSSYFIHILQECATVKEVITWVQEHQWHKAMHYQMHFADATGDAVVISAGLDGQIAFTRKPEGDSYLVSTNFNLANPVNGSYPCWRYERAQLLLDKAIQNGQLSIEKATEVLDEVHVADATNWTILSVLGDLPKGQVYVYLFHQFDAPIVLDIAKEIARAPEPGPVDNLFPEATLNQVDKAYRDIKTRGAWCKVPGITWLILATASSIILGFLAKAQQKRRVYWAVVGLVLGPVGVIFGLLVLGDKQGTLAEQTVGDLCAPVIGMVSSLLIAVHVPRIGQSSLAQLALYYSLPLILGLIYAARRTARRTHPSNDRAIPSMVPSTLIATNISLAGILAFNGPLIPLCFRFCGLTVATVFLWWAITSLGALVGGIILLQYRRRSIRGETMTRATSTNYVLSTTDQTGKVFFPPSYRVWIKVFFSYVIFILGLGLGILGSMLISG
jgi:hypothetical protein